jgi:glycosyltransferase involved in cell wall biosynthesis
LNKAGNETMKIAMVFDQFLYGGIERVGTFYIQLLQKAGHQVDVYILNRQIEDFIQEIPDGCTVTKLPYDLRYCPEGTWPLAMQGDRAGLEMAFFAFKYVGRKLLHTVTKPHFTQKHTQYDLAIAFAGHIRDLTFVSSGCIPAKHTLAWLHGAQYQYALMSPGFYRLYKKIGNLVCLSELCDSECVKFNQKNHIRKRKIFNPCALTRAAVDEEKVRSLQAAYGDFCLMVARLAQDKDQETVLYAMHYLKTQLHLPKKLLLVGDGPKREALEQLTAQLELTDDVIFEGTRSDVQNYYSAAYMYVHAALLEGLPTVFLEAMSYGLPVVTTDAIPGAGEILQQGEIGLISPNKDPQALAKNIARLYNDTALRQTLIDKGSRRIADFHPDVIGKQINDYLQEIVDS